MVWYAVVANNTAVSNPDYAKRLGIASIVLSVLSIVITVPIIAVVVNL